MCGQQGTDDSCHGFNMRQTNLIQSGEREMDGEQRNQGRLGSGRRCDWGDREYRDVDSAGEHSGLRVVFEWAYCAHGGQG